MSISFIYPFKKKEYLFLLFEKRKLKVIKSNINNANRCNMNFTKKILSKKVDTNVQNPNVLEQHQTIP